MLFELADETAGQFAVETGSETTGHFAFELASETAGQFAVELASETTGQFAVEPTAENRWSVCGKQQSLRVLRQITPLWNSTANRATKHT